MRMFLLAPFEPSSAPLTSRIRASNTKTLGLTALVFLSRAHTGDRGHRFPDLVPARHSRWTLNVNDHLTVPTGY